MFRTRHLLATLTSLLVLAQTHDARGEEPALQTADGLKGCRAFDEKNEKELMELQMQLELGDIDDAEFVRREADIMVRLREVRAWRERLGKPVSGGLVKVSGEGDDTQS